jgi:cellulose synthase/poly-beta-1,6-N-acetylglucosamine synthase-like glycosyltransferase
MRAILTDILVGFDRFMLVYLVILTVWSTILVAMGWRAVEEYVRRRPLRDYRAVANSPLSLPVSILAPAYNEGPVIASAIRSLIRSQFVNFEVIVINDGSKDDTFEVLKREFALVKVERVPMANIATKQVRGVWVSPIEPQLVVVDKENGGKADALNAGLKYALFPLFCAIDADTMLDPDALSRLVWEFQASPDTVAAGGIVRIINGSVVRDGKIVEVKTPRSRVVNLQIIEYLRAFLGGRIGWSRVGMLMIISGAFGLFRRDVVVAAGGYDTTTVGEDAELVLRLHRYRRDRKEPCRITFFPDPICWTEAPSSLKVLVRQRDRWQRGLMEMLWKHRGMIGRPRYGRIGLFATPYFVLFEMLGPTIEVLGYFAVAASAALGLISPTFTALLLGLSVSYGLVLSFATIMMEERAFRRYPGWRCLRRLTGAAILENVGYRQLIALVRMRAWWTLFRRKSHWGEMTRAGFETPAQSGGEIPSRTARV